MDVNRDNFLSILPEIFGEIDQADFVALDGEFTGILTLRQMGFFDTPAQRYQSHHECDRQYLMIQFGLAMIRCIDSQKNQYALKAYNFYLYPENESDAIDFSSRSSSLQFLAENHFDFNQLFLKGIPSISKVKYLDRVQPSSSRSRTDAQRRSDRMKNAFQQNITTNLSDADRKMVGFSQVIWKLQESGKPIIGHNLYTDIIHLINQFFLPIPAAYDDYKLVLKTLFPRIIDTKLLASTSFFQDIMSNTALNAVYKTVREKPFPECHFEVPQNFKYAQGEHEHTAGYDAACTGICMAKMMVYIAGQTNFQDNPIQHPLINSLIGKFFLMGSFDFKYVDMYNDDEFPDRSGVFYVKHAPTWSTFNLRQYFQQWGHPFLDRHNATTHIVALSLGNQTTDTHKMRAGNKSLNISSYAQFHRLDLSKIKLRQPNPLFDIDPAKRNPNIINDATAAAAADNEVPSSPMDTAATPVFDGHQ